VEEGAKQLCETVPKSAEEIGWKVMSRKEEKLKPETKALLKKRREMKRETTRDNIEYTKCAKPSERT